MHVDVSSLVAGSPRSPWRDSLKGAAQALTVWSAGRKRPEVGGALKVAEWYRGRGKQRGFANPRMALPLSLSIGVTPVSLRARAKAGGLAPAIAPAQRLVPHTNRLT